MKKKILLLTLLGCFFLLSLLSWDRKVLGIDFALENQRVWRELLSAHPLPSGFPLPEKDKSAQYQLTVVDQEAHRENALSKAFRVRHLAPSAPLWDFTISKNSKSLKPADLQDIETITLPRKALRVDGKFPGEKDYPFSQNLWLTISPIPPKGSALRDWWDTLPSLGDEKVIRLGAVGDLLPSRGVEKFLPLPGGLENTLNDILPEVQNNDYLVGNLEGPVTTRGVPLTALKYYIFKFPPEILPPLKKAGFNYLTVANNHVFDQGLDGFIDTLAALRSQGFDTSGSGMNLKDALVPAQKKINNLNLVISSFACYPVEGTGFSGADHAAAGEKTPGTVWKNPEGLAGLKVNFKKYPGYHIVMAHGGIEGSTDLDPEVQTIYHDLIDAGADLIVGSHPHVLQGFETYKGKLILYSLGDFIFPDMWDVPMAEESIFLRLGIYAGRVAYVECYPVEVKDVKTYIAKNPLFMDRLAGLIKALNP